MHYEITGRLYNIALLFERKYNQLNTSKTSRLWNIYSGEIRWCLVTCAILNLRYLGFFHLNISCVLLLQRGFECAMTRSLQLQSCLGGGKTECSGRHLLHLQYLMYCIAAGASIVLFIKVSDALLFYIRVNGTLSSSTSLLISWILHFTLHIL